MAKSVLDLQEDTYRLDYKYMLSRWTAGSQEDTELMMNCRKSTKSVNWKKSYDQWLPPHTDL